MGTSTSTQTVQTQTPVQTPVKPSRRRKFLQALQRLSAAASLNNEKIAKNARERFDKVKDKISGTMHENDCVRRLERLRALLAEFNGDPRYADAVTLAGQDLSTFETDLANGRKTPAKANWTELYEKIGVTTQKLNDTVKTFTVAEKTGRGGLDDQPKKDLAEVERKVSGGTMSVDDRAAFTQRLNQLRVSLIDVGLGKKDAAKKFPGDVAKLLGDVNAKLQQNTTETQRLMTLHAQLGDRLAAAADGEGGAEKRVAIAELLQQAQAKIELCAFGEAGPLLNKAATALDTIGAPATGSLPTADGVLERLATLRDKVRKAMDDAAPIRLAHEKDLENARAKIQGPARVSDKLWAMREHGVQLGNEALHELETVQFMLREAPESAGPANRLIDRCEKPATHAIEVLTDALKLFGDPNAKIGTGGDATDRGKKRAAAEKLVDDMLNNATSACEWLSSAVSPEGTTLEGELSARLNDIRTRWEKLKGDPSLGAEDLDTATFLKDLKRLQADADQRFKDWSSNKYGAEDIAFEQQMVAFREAVAELKKVASGVMERDSDKAIELGLATKPDALAGKADALATQQTQARGEAADVTKRTADLLKLTNEVKALTVEANKVAPVLDDDALNNLRQRSLILVSQYTQRIDTAVKAAKNENLLLASKRDERTALLAYAETLKSAMSEIAAPLPTKDAGLLEEIRTSLVTFEARIIDFEKRAPGKNHDDKLPKFTDVKTKAEELKKRITSGSVLPKRPEIQSDLNEELAPYLTDFAKLVPATALAELAKLDKKITDAKTLAHNEHKAAELLWTELNNLWPPVVKAKDKSDKKYGPYFNDLVAQVRKLVTDLQAKDKIEKADQTKADQLKKDVADALAGRNLDKGLATTEKNEKDRQAVAYKLDSLEEVDLKLLKEQSGRLTGKAGTELAKQVNSMTSTLKVARGMIESGDIAGAKEMADAIQRQCKRMAEAPLGSSTRSRNRLPQVQEDWRASVRTMDQALTRLVTRVRTADTGNAKLDEAADKLDAKIKELRDLFRAEAFAGAISRMTKGDPKPADLGAAREDALREVRRIRKLMEANPLLRQLAAIPFDGAGLPLADIGARLWDMETNLNISGE